MVAPTIVPTNPPPPLEPRIFFMMKPIRREPPTPRRMVRRQPLGSPLSPGEIAFAKTPAMPPTMIHQMISIACEIANHAKGFHMPRTFIIGE